MNFELNNTYATEDGVNLICYEQTERFSLLCPFSVSEDDETLTLNVANTLIYSNDINEETNMTAIQKITIQKQDTPNNEES